MQFSSLISFKIALNCASLLEKPLAWKRFQWEKIARKGERQAILQSLPLSFYLWYADNRLSGLLGFGVVSQSCHGISGGQLLDGKQYLQPFGVLSSQTFCNYWKDAKSLRQKKKKED